MEDQNLRKAECSVFQGEVDAVKFKEAGTRWSECGGERREALAWKG